MLLTSKNENLLMLESQGRLAEFRDRKKEFLVRKVAKKEFSGEPEDGWEVHSELRTSFNLRKPKQADEVFEDKIWTMFHNLGVHKLSSGRHLELSYGKEDHEKQQIDVLAIDDGVAFVVECRKSESNTFTKSNFKTTIEALSHKKTGIRQALRAIYGRDLRVGFIFATEGYQISQPDKQRLRDGKIFHFSESETKYYESLAAQLGSAGKYQLFADIFPNGDIKDLDNRVYALEGRMGNHKYYTFNIQPHKLLKISYVLHRSKMQSEKPNYQRVIKRNRLKAIREFVNNGGFFPNSLIINLTNSRKIKFDPSQQQLETSLNRAGVLHLPKQFRSAYIIDGQHRLYGYSGSKYEATNTIPVVAFVGLDRQEQLKIFVDINENQKAVPANLRFSLEEDLFISSDIAEEKVRGVRSSIIRKLGEDNSSPLYDRILLGEDPRTETRLISVSSIIQGINRSKLLPDCKKNAFLRPGAFGDHDLIAAGQKIFDLLNGCFNILQDSVPEEWNKKQIDRGLMTVPNGANALISIFGDLVLFLANEEKISLTSDNPEKIIKEMAPYLEVVARFFDTMAFDMRERLASEKGGGAPIKIQNTIRQFIKAEFESFNPEGLDDFIKQQDAKFNTETFQLCSDLESEFRTRIKEKLIEQLGTKKWDLEGIPGKIFNELTTTYNDERRSGNVDEETQEFWDFSNFMQIKQVIEKNWSLFESDFMFPGKGNARKTDKTVWLVRLNEIRRLLAHGRGNATIDDYEWVKAIHDWQIKGQTEQLLSIPD